MSATFAGIIPCPELQDDLNNQFTQSNPLAAVVPMGLSEFIESAANTNGMLQRQTAPGEGKTREVVLLYTPQICEDDVSENAIKVCSSSNEAGMLSKRYSLEQNEGVEYNELFSLTSLAAMCKDNRSWFSQRLQAIMDGLELKTGTIIANQAAVLTGKFASGDNNLSNADMLKTVRTKKTNGDFDIDALEEILFSATNASYRTTPVVFGFGEIYKYMQKVNAGCCAIDGLDIGQYAANGRVVFVSDKKVQQALGGENFLMLAPGALQVISWNEFEGAFNVANDDSYKQMTIVNPKTGRKYDMLLKNNCGEISLSLKRAFKVVALPTDMYQSCSDFSGVTFVNEFAINNA